MEPTSSGCDESAGFGSPAHKAFIHSFTNHLIAEGELVLRPFTQSLTLSLAVLPHSAINYPADLAQSPSPPRLRLDPNGPQHPRPSRASRSPLRPREWALSSPRRSRFIFGVLGTGWLQGTAAAKVRLAYDPGHTPPPRKGSRFGNIDTS